MMKATYFSFVFVLMFSVAFSQSTTTTYTFKSDVSTTLFANDKPDSLVVYSIEMLGKTAWEEYLDTDKINLSPKNFSWYSDMRKIESYKNLILNTRRQDNCGRDMPIDVHYEVTQKAYLRGVSDR